MELMSSHGSVDLLVQQRLGNVVEMIVVLITREILLPVVALHHGLVIVTVVPTIVALIHTTLAKMLAMVRPCLVPLLHGNSQLFLQARHTVPMVVMQLQVMVTLQQLAWELLLGLELLHLLLV